MSIPPRREYVVRTAARFMLACMIVGGFYPVILGSADPDGTLLHPVLNGVAAGFLAGAFITAGELRWFQTVGKRMKFLPYLLLQSAYYLIVIDISAFCVSILSAALFHGATPGGAEGPAGGGTGGASFVAASLYALVAIFLVNFVRQVNRFLGQKALLHFVTGRYHAPVEEERVFMFLDIRDSAAIAEKLGHRRYHEFLNDFFFDITPAIVESRGEIHRYAGGEVVVTWAGRAGTVPPDCIYCWFRIAAAVARTTRKYEEKYGFIPECRAGIHYGPVVTGFIGDVKRDVVYQGDTVDIASRIRTECTTVNRNLLLSGDLMKNVVLSGSLTPERVGRIRLKGREREIEIFTLAEAA